MGRAFAYIEDVLAHRMHVDDNAREHNRFRSTPGAQRWCYYEAARWWSVTREALAAFGRTLGDLDDAHACAAAYDRWCLDDRTCVEVETAAHRYGGRS